MDKRDRQNRELIGYAFAHILEPAIPNGTCELIQICEGNLGRTYSEMKKRLAREPDVKTGGATALKLTAFGLTPLHIVLATDAIALLFECAIDAKFFLADKPICLSFSLQSYGDNLITAAHEEKSKKGLTQGELIQEIAGFAEVDGRKAMVLLRWIIGIAKFIPFIFIGFRATWKNDKLELVQLKPDKTPNHLFLRWSNYKFLE